MKNLIHILNIGTNDKQVPLATFKFFRSGVFIWLILGVIFYHHAFM